MATFPVKAPRKSVVRGTLIVQAFVLACFSVWYLGGELLRKPYPSFPTDKQIAQALADNRGVATQAARISVLRGDLWAESALTYVGLFWENSRHDTTGQPSGLILEARETADRAIIDAPHDSRIWLILAALRLQSGEDTSSVAGALRMSYYTGPNELDLIPFRLLVAAQSEAITDQEIQGLVRHDVLAIVTRKPNLKSAIMEAYRSGSPAARRIFDGILQDSDPTLLQAIQRGA